MLIGGLQRLKYCDEILQCLFFQDWSSVEPPGKIILTPGLRTELSSFHAPCDNCPAKIFVYCSTVQELLLWHMMCK